MKIATCAANVPDNYKIRVYESLRAYFEGALSSYFTDDIPTDPRYDSGVAAETTECIGLEVDTDGWLHVVMQIKGWADHLAFSIELPTLSRDEFIGDGWIEFDE